MGFNTGDFLKRTFRLKQNESMGFYITDFLFRRILRRNADVPWAVHHTSTIHSPHMIKRGKNVYPGDSPGVYISARSGIKIGDYSNIGPNAGLISANHDLIDNDVHIDSDPIDIGKFCWIGMNTVILPGVKLGDFTIVGAGAIVTRSFPDGYCVLGGNPAKIIKQLNRTECEAFARTKD